MCIYIYICICKCVYIRICIYINIVIYKYNIIYIYICFLKVGVAQITIAFKHRVTWGLGTTPPTSKCVLSHQELVF